MESGFGWGRAKKGIGISVPIDICNGCLEVLVLWHWTAGGRIEVGLEEGHKRN